MLNATLADKLTSIAVKQLAEGLEAKKKRMDVLSEIMDLYNNKTIELDSDMMNIPFPMLSGQIDSLFAKIDEPPTLDFKVPNRPTLSDKIKSAWMMDMSSTRAGWKRKDRSEKKMALLSGRAVAKIYASSVGNEYHPHYEIVDIFSFVADPTRGWLMDGNYHGETDIFKTEADLKRGVKAGFYNAENVVKVLSSGETPKDGNAFVAANKFDRLKALGIDVEKTSFAGQKGSNLTEWVMRYENEWYYLFFDPITSTWVRAELLKDVFENNSSPFVSWATHYDEFAFWSKGPADDIYPTAEAVRFLLNNALENEKRRVRPMRIVAHNMLMNVNELQDYVPDNVILANPGANPNIITVETPQTTTTINLIEFLDAAIKDKVGVTDQGVSEADPKVGVYYGRLQEAADRIGIINKEYSESYAHKGYNYFWGLKQHLTGKKQIEMLGKGGIKLQQLSSIDFKDVDDVDDVMVSGGSAEQTTTAVEQQQQLAAIKELTATYADRMNPDWVIGEVLKRSGFDEEDIQAALDMDSVMNKETLEEADQAIQSILLGKTPPLNMAADIQFVQRIIDYVRNELNYVLLDKNGNETGIDKKAKEQSELLLAYVQAHQRIVAENLQRKQAKAAMLQSQMQQGMPAQSGDGGVNVQTAPQNPGPSNIAPDQGPPPGTQGGTQSQSAQISGAIS